MDPAAGASAVLERIVSDARSLMQKYGSCCAVGVAVPGPYLRREGRIAVMTEFAGWEKIDICKQLGAAFEQPVFVEHDANAGALGEWSRSANIGRDDVLVHLLASEGIGAGVVIGGKIISGYRGIFGEIGHMSINAMGPRCLCGNRGCLEMYCSALALVRDVQAGLPEHPESSLTSEQKITAEVIFRHMNAGDAYSRSAVLRTGHSLGCGVANLVNIYDPKEIVISDVMSGGGEVMLQAIREAAKERLLPEVWRDLTIRYSAVPEDLILYGAASVAIDKIPEKTDAFSPSGADAPESKPL